MPVRVSPPDLKKIMAGGVSGQPENPPGYATRYKSSYIASPVAIYPNLSNHAHSKNNRYSAYRHSPSYHIVDPCCFSPTLEARCFYFSVCHRHNMSFTYSLPLSIFGQFPFFHSRNPAPRVGYTTILPHPNICLMLKILSNGNKEEEKVQTTHETVNKCRYKHRLK